MNQKKCIVKYSCSACDNDQPGATFKVGFESIDEIPIILDKINCPVCQGLKTISLKHDFVRPFGKKKSRFNVDRDHPDPSRMIFLPNSIAQTIQAANPGKFHSSSSVTMPGKKQLGKVFDIGTINYPQNELRNGDKIILFSLDTPGEYFVQTVRGYNPSNDSLFTCRTEKFFYDFSNFFWTVKIY